MSVKKHPKSNIENLVAGACYFQSKDIVTIRRIVQENIYFVDRDITTIGHTITNPTGKITSSEYIQPYG